MQGPTISCKRDRLQKRGLDERPGEFRAGDGYFKPVSSLCLHGAGSIWKGRFEEIGVFKSEIKDQIEKKKIKTVTKVERQTELWVYTGNSEELCLALKWAEQRGNKVGLERCVISRLEAKDYRWDSAAGSGDCWSVWVHMISSEQCLGKINFPAAGKMDGNGKDCRQQHQLGED